MSICTLDIKIKKKKNQLYVYVCVCMCLLLTCNSVLCSKLYALGLPSSVENATLPSRNGEISLYSLVQNARDSDSPFFPVRNSDKLSGKPYVSRHVALLDAVVINGVVNYVCKYVQ